ncbi:glycerophosphodiester phosphodiesterase [Cryomorpha ignava]|nr:glycerophosphodiester phosphodiesterase [Cryomorpha ignava]
MDSNQIVQKNADFQGHRGCRGLMPENTIPGFLRALDLGVTTLEMDVVVTKDHRVICSHEPWFSHDIALDPSGIEIKEENEKNHRIYAMDYTNTQNYDVGLKLHPRFPDQQKLPAHKPLLEDVIDSAEYHAGEKKRELPYYNIETKTTPEGDGIFHPSPEVFVDLLLEIIYEKGIAERTIIQSFDTRTLQYIHIKHPDIKLALLIENDKSIEHNIQALGFIPDIYSPDFTLVNANLIAFCHRKKIEVIPWTVNELSDMKVLILLGVDGLISDYPDRFKSL